MVVLLLAIAVFLVGVVALPMLAPAREEGAVGNAPPTRSPSSTPAPTAPAIAGPTFTVVESPAALPTPTITSTPEVLPPPTEPPTAAPDPTAAPEPTPEPTPAPTRRPRPDPTPRPERTRRPTPEPTPTPPPPVRDVSVRIADRFFVGDYDGPGSGRYHGRSASWVYGQGTPYHTMTLRFRLTDDGQVSRRASLQVVGLDGESRHKNRMSIVLNGSPIYKGPSPFPNDVCCGRSGPGNWGSAVFEFPGELLRRNNSLSVINLEPSDCTHCSFYVMVDYAVLEYRVRPEPARRD
jgi:hypothetical protein